MNKLLVFSKEDCTPCKMVKQLLKGEGVTEFTDIDVIKNEGKAREYGVMSVPVAILLDDNDNEIARSVGFNPEELNKIISKI